MNQQDETRRNSAQQQADSLAIPKALPDETDIGGGIPYKLRIGVTGHRDLEHPDKVREAIEHVIDDLVRILTAASRDPHGAHGSPQSPVQRLDRWLGRCLSIGSRQVCPMVNCELRAPDHGLFSGGNSASDP